MEDEPRGGEEDTAEAIPFVTMGRFQEGNLGEDPSSSPKGCALQSSFRGGVARVCFQWS